METVGRKWLSHDVPLSINPSREVFFLTICSRIRSGAPLIPQAVGLLEAIRFRHENGNWWIHVAVVMPDHVHLLAGFHAGSDMAGTVRKWKQWTARHQGADWQRGFFGHRLRSQESMREKADYILENPVRAGLVARWQDWPHLWIPDGRQ